MEPPDDVLVADLGLIGLELKVERAIPRVPVISVFHYRNGKQQERWFHPTDLDAWNRMLS
jgi:hypothetical protein